MDVDHAEPWDLQQGLGQQLAVGGDDAEIGRQVADRTQKLIVAEPVGLKYRYAALCRQGLGRCRNDVMAAAARTVRLRDHGHDPFA